MDHFFIETEIFMKIKIIISIVIILVVFGLVLLASKSSVPNNSISTTNDNSNNNSNNTSAGTNTSMLFSNQPYAPYSYLIYPGTPSPQSQAALAGFNLSGTQLQN
jgi:hypothetical protein